MSLSPPERQQLDRIAQDLSASRGTARRMSERQWRRGLVHAVLAVASADLDALAVMADANVGGEGGAAC
jgi:hypothetical protein